MESLSKFCILRYVPDENRQEFINLGLVFHSPADNFIDIKITNNFSRVSAFDDEVDINFLKIVIEGLKEDFSQTTISGPTIKEIQNLNYLESKTSIFVNQLQFSPIYTFRSKEINLDFDNLFRTYVYFDVHRKKRITDDEVKSTMNRVLRSSNVFSMLNRNLKVDLGPEKIELDYAYNSRNKIKIIKTFSFDYTNQGSSQATSTAKEWAYNFQKLKLHKSNNKIFDYINSIDFITFVYIENENKNINTALKILEEESSIVTARGMMEVERFATYISKDVDSNLPVST